MKVARPLLALLIVSAAGVAGAQPAAASGPTPAPVAAAQARSVSEVYDGHALAYDRKDADAFAAFFAADAVIYRFPNEPLMRGRAAIRDGFRRFWEAHPNSVSQEIARIVAGPRVIERNVVRQLDPRAGGDMVSTQIVEIRDGLIRSIWVLSE